jgi:protein gp37
MGATSIEWTGRTVNPFKARNRQTGKRGHVCVMAGPECTNCYSEGWQFRLGTRLPFRPFTLPLVDLELDERALQEVLTRQAPDTWFWCDMTDLFLSVYPDEWLDRCFLVMEETPQHTHQILTKRAERMARYLTGRYGSAVPPHIWCGVSCGNRKDGLPRLDVLRGIGARVRFVSCEPLLEDLGAVDLRDLHWLILGGESRQRKPARPCDLAWLHSLVRQGWEQGVLVFVKQLGDHVIHEGVRFRTRKSKGSNPAEWPEDLRVRQVPAKSG